MPDKLINTAGQPVPASELGRVLVHEHLFCRVAPPDVPTACEYLSCQLARLADQGVKTVVDLTTYVLPDRFLRVLERHPVHVVCCAGYYLLAKVPAAYRHLDERGLTEKLREKMENGIGSRHILPGVIKVASSGLELTRFERDAIRAAGIVQSEYGVPVVTHACRGGRRQFLELLAAGANPQQVLLSHTEMELKGRHSRSFDAVLGDLLWVLERGGSLFFGDFSVRDSPYRQQVVRLLRECYLHGHQRQLFISTDSFWSCRGGRVVVRGSASGVLHPRSYDYVFRVIVPLLTSEGFSASDISLFLEDNPHRLFLGLAPS
jgi:phosphotriesterase-related protein